MGCEGTLQVSVRVDHVVTPRRPPPILISVPSIKVLHTMVHRILGIVNTAPSLTLNFTEGGMVHSDGSVTEEDHAERRKNDYGRET